MSLNITNLHITTAAVKPKTIPPRAFTVSPAINGNTYWNLDVSGSLNVGTSGIWTLTPNKNFSASIKMWGGGGGTLPGTVNANGGTGGGGGYSYGTASFVAGTNYTMVVGDGAKFHSITASYNIGNGGYGRSTSAGTQYGIYGGGMSGIFSGSYTQAGACIIAGGGASVARHRYDADQAGGGGGSMGSDGFGFSRGYPASGLGGTQLAGGAGEGGASAGGALVGGLGLSSADRSAGGGGGYFGGGAGSYRGGGGSGYIRTGVISGGGTVGAGTTKTPANSEDPLRNGAGSGAVGMPYTAATGSNGRVIIT